MKKNSINVGRLNERINFEVKYAKNLLKNLAEHSNLTIDDCITELVDNGKEATLNVGRVEVGIAAPNLPEDVTLLISDNGCGMSKEELEEMFFVCGEGDETKPGIHAKLGGRMAISKLCACRKDDKKPAYVVMVTKKEGCPAVKVVWDGEGNPTGEYMSESEKVSNGTVFAFHNVDLSLDDAEKYKPFASTRFCKAIENGFTLIVNGQKLTPENPLYPEFDKEGEISKTFAGETLVVGPKDGKTYVVKYSVRDLSMFYSTDEQRLKYGFIPHQWDRGKDGKCIINERERMGAFVMVDDIMLVFGGVTSPYIRRTEHAQMNGKRLLLEIPGGLARQLNYQVNKSQGFVGFNRVHALKQLVNDMTKCFENVIQGSVTRAKADHEREVREYKDVKVVSGTRNEVRFAVDDNMSMPKGVFAIKDNGSNKILFNPNSSLLTGVKANLKGFRIAAGVAESVYIAALEALEDTKKFQPKFSMDNHPRSISVSSRDQVLEYFKEAFENRFMMMTQQ